MKYPEWQYRFMHKRLTKMGLKPLNIHFKRSGKSFYVGFYYKGTSIIHIEDLIKGFQEFIKRRHK